MDFRLAEQSFAEQSVIGCLLMGAQDLPPELVAQTFSGLSGAMFADENLREIFECCKELHAKGKPIDVAVVDGILSSTEKRVAMLRCAELTPSVHSLERYVQGVFEQWRRREMALELEEISSTCVYVSATEATRRLERLLNMQRSIEQGIKDESARGFFDCAVEFYADLQQPSNALTTGWQDFDYLTGGLQRNGVYVITARPGKGKTDFALNLAMRLSKQFRASYHSMEMPRKQLMRRVIARSTRINSIRLRDKIHLSDDDYAAIIRSIDLLKKHTQLILDEEQYVAPENIEAKIIKHNPDVLFIDHLGLMQHNPHKKNQWEATGETTRMLKSLAMKYNIAIVELVQSTREADNRKSKTPKLSELRGGGSVEADADGVFVIEPEETQDIISGNNFLLANVHVIKNRHGGTGLLKFHWMPQYHFWTEINHIHEGR